MMRAYDTRTSPASVGRKLPLDVEKIRRDFPALHQQVHGKPLVYLDNAATSQKPRAVIDRIARYSLAENANVHRGIHFLSEQATRAYEEARVKVQRFLNAREAREIIFTRGTTEAINLVAHSYGRQNVKEGDEVIISAIEHHSNIVPWQILCQEKGATLRIIPVNDDGELLLDRYEKLLNERTRIVAVAHVSNSLGTINPVKRIIEMAHRRGVPGARLRLLRLLRPQALRPHRHRRALRQGEAARGDAPISGRRRYDQLGHLRENGLQYPPL